MFGWWYAAKRKRIRLERLSSLLVPSKFVFFTWKFVFSYTNNVLQNLEVTSMENWFKIMKTTSEAKISGEIYLDIKYKPEGDGDGSL